MLPVSLTAGLGPKAGQQGCTQSFSCNIHDTGLEPTARVGAVAGQARQQGEGAPEAAASAGEQRTHQAAAANPPSPARDPASGSDADTGGELMRLLLRQVCY